MIIEKDYHAPNPALQQSLCYLFDKRGVIANMCFHFPTGQERLLQRAGVHPADAQWRHGPRAGLPTPGGEGQDSGGVRGLLAERFWAPSPVSAASSGGRHLTHLLLNDLCLNSLQDKIMSAKQHHR